LALRRKKRLLRHRPHYPPGALECTIRHRHPGTRRRGPGDHRGVRRLFPDRVLYP